MCCWETRKDATGTSEEHSHTYSAHLLVQCFIIKSVEWLCKRKKGRKKLSEEKKGKNPFEGHRTPFFRGFSHLSLCDNMRCTLTFLTPQKSCKSNLFTYSCIAEGNKVKLFEPTVSGKKNKKLWHILFYPILSFSVRKYLGRMHLQT